jgi:hypothetical protein
VWWGGAGAPPTSNSEAAVREATKEWNRTVGKHPPNGRFSCLNRRNNGTLCSMREARKMRRKVSFRRRLKFTSLPSCVLSRCRAHEFLQKIAGRSRNYQVRIVSPDLRLCRVWNNLVSIASARSMMKALYIIQ